MLLMTGKMTIWKVKSSRWSYSFDLIFLGCRFQIEGRGKKDATAKDYPLTLATCSILVYFVVELPCISTCVSVSTLVHVTYLFEGATALFQLEYFTKNFVHTTPTTFKTLHPFLLLYHDLHIVTAVWSDKFWRSYCPFRLKILHQYVYGCGRHSKITFNYLTILFY